MVNVEFRGWREVLKEEMRFAASRPLIVVRAMMLDNFGFPSQKNDSIAHFLRGLSFSYGFQSLYALS
jgi:hypothetical protein